MQNWEEASFYKCNFQICILGFIYLTYIGWPFKVKLFGPGMLPKDPHTQKKILFWIWQTLGSILRQKKFDLEGSSYIDQINHA